MSSSDVDFGVESNQKTSTRKTALAVAVRCAVTLLMMGLITVGPSLELSLFVGPASLGLNFQKQWAGHLSFLSPTYQSHRYCQRRVEEKELQVVADELPVRESYSHGYQVLNQRLKVPRLLRVPDELV